MTLFPTGDRGQRYEILSTGSPMEGEITMGWTEQRHDAERMAGSFRKAPGCIRTRIRDRWKQEADVINEVAR